ncbi:hypothetical protein ACFRCI_23590 [Streptomyces sp. NPDC056638]
MSAETFRIVRAEPDDEPVPRCVYASWNWLTEDFMRKAESG